MLLLGACSNNVEVTISTSADYAVNGWDVYGVDTVWVTLHPYYDAYTVELLIDSAVVGVDTFPGPASGFVWNVSQLPEAGVHRLQARAISGSREYLSREDSVWVGLRSRLIVDGSDKTFSVDRPDGVLEVVFTSVDNAEPSYPRLGTDCHSVVFLAAARLPTLPYQR